MVNLMAGLENSSHVFEVGVEDRHREVERTIAILVVHEEDAYELLADIHLRRIGFLRPPDDADRVVCKGLAQVALDFRHLGLFHYEPFLTFWNAARATGRGGLLPPIWGG